VFRPSRIVASAVLIGGMTLAAVALADDPHHGGGGGTHTGGPHAGGTVPAIQGNRAGSPHTGYTGVHGTMPQRGFRGVPSNFHGRLPQGGPAPSHLRARHEIGRPGHDLGMFRGRNFAHFTPSDRAAWQHGEWRHTWHDGHYGWWWFVGNSWFFYPAPIYPYPLYIGSLYYYDYYDQYGAPDYYWYYCEDPPGYYPYVQQCNGPWEPVPPSDQ
jgi:hypothetical protein